MHKTRYLGLCSLALAALFAACSEDESTAPTGTTGPGASGSAGSGGSAGTSPQGGSGGGSAGSETGGNAGSSAVGGTSSSAGAGGSGVAGLGGSGTAGSGAAAGSGPVAGSGGSGASAGQGGAPGNCTTEADCAAYRTPDGQGAVPPAKAGGGTADGATALTHAVSRWFLGESNKQGNPDPSAWKDIGFDIDGWSSTAGQGFHCKPAAGAKFSDIATDGNKGTDNSFGRNIVGSILAALISVPSDEWTTQVTDGNESKLLDLGKLGSAANYDAAPSKALWVFGQQSGGTPVPPPPADWSGYAWSPVMGTPAATTDFPGAYLAGNTWVSGEAPTLEVRIAFTGFVWTIPVRKARMTLDLTDRKRGVSGNLGGLILTEDLTTSFKKLAGNFDTSFCGNSATIESILEQLRQASDILQDGTQDSAKQCDAVSIGLGFETRASKLGAEVPAPVEPDPCAN